MQYRSVFVLYAPCVTYACRSRLYAPARQSPVEAHCDRNPLDSLVRLRARSLAPVGCVSRAHAAYRSDCPHQTPLALCRHGYISRHLPAGHRPSEVGHGAAERCAASASPDAAALPASVAGAAGVLSEAVAGVP